jgi:hypothetical protein
MQRWIAIGVLAMMLVVGGGAFAWWNQKQNAPAPMWVPLPIRAEIPADERDEMISELNTKLHNPELLRQVVQDEGLIELWNLSSEREAVQQLSGRVFVRMGDMATPMGNMPAVHIGVTGKVKEREQSGRIAERVMKDVWKILGVQPPEKR